MNNFWIMVGYAFMNKAKSKQFIITTIIVLLGIIVMANLENITSVFDDGEESIDQIAVISDEVGYYSLLEEQVEQSIIGVELVEADGEMEVLENEVLEGEYKGILILSEDEQGLPSAKYMSESLTSSFVQYDIESSLQFIRSQLAAQALNLDAESLAILNSPVPFEVEALSEDAKTAEELDEARGLVYVLLFFIYFTVIMYSSIIATDVANEKSSRVMEILISSVSPVKQMFSKIIGIGLLGLAQMAIWLLVGYVVLTQSGSDLTGGFFEFFGFENIAFSTIIYAVVFFFLGYFLYATLAALLGSLVSRVEEVQQIILPMMLLIIIAFFISMFGLSNPESTVVTVTSYIPFFTPLVMFLRIGMLNIPAWEAMLGIAIMIATIWVLGWFGAKVYRGGVLMYGKSGGLKDIRKAIKLTKS
ncbi:hypothetical protein Q73_03470 [Bacillus coahuilensis m2-6]|uniref:ABC transporter permease n=1 Tax=Bacillus coahuilensis TaxID=408580 RepID=UPI00075061B9|nr:ABC transporter permease [Bacillus coahuilensis]KUP09346.1 hypothetical protein Q73_03470 [Bacillus coahuilensis m2-6]